VEKYLKLTIIIFIAVFLAAIASLLLIINARQDGGQRPHVSPPAEKVGENITQIAEELLPPQEAQKQMKKYLDQHGSILKNKSGEHE